LAKDAQNIGKLQGEADIDFGRLESSVNKLEGILKKLDPSMKKVEKGLGGVESSAQRASIASQALAAGLGYLGASSINQVIWKIMDLGRQSLQLAMNLQAVENRARAVFGDAFPQMVKSAQQLGDQFKRSASDILEFETGFALLMDSVGASPGMIQRSSKELAGLALTIGKAFPAMDEFDIYQKLESGIMGNNKALKALSITVNDNLLQSYLKGEGITKKLKDMDSEERMMVRINYLLTQTKTLQDAAAKSTGQMADQVATAKAVWKDFLEGGGTAVLNFFSILTNNINAALNPLREFVYWIGKYSGASKGLATPGTTLNPDGTVNYNGPRMKGAKNVGSATETGGGESLADYISGHVSQGMGGAGGETLTDKLAKAEKDLLDALKEEADANLANLKIRKEDLDLRKKLGILTKDEAYELGRINSRLAMMPDKISEATDAWEKQSEKVKDLRKEIGDLERDILKQSEELEKDLDKIDENTKKKKAEAVADLLKERDELEKRVVYGEGLSPEQIDRRRQINEILQRIKGEGYYKEGEQMAAAQISGDAFGTIDAEATAEKKEIAKEANEKLAETQAELFDKQKQLNSAVATEGQLRSDLVAAMDAYKATIETNYPLIEKATQDHVAAEIAQYQKLQAQLNAVANAYARASRSGGGAAVAAVQKASGGMIVGPGGPTDDRVPALLSNGEYVHKTAAVQYYGKSFMDAINSLRLPRFAQGGPVSYDQRKNQTMHFNYYGEAARVAADPSMIRWNARRAI